MELTTYSPTFQSIFSKLNGRVSSCVTKNKLSLRRHNCLLNSLVHYLINLKQFIFERHMSWNCLILSVISDSNLAFNIRLPKVILYTLRKRNDVRTVSLVTRFVDTVYREIFALALFSPLSPSLQLSAGEFTTGRNPMSEIISL